MGLTTGTSCGFKIASTAGPGAFEVAYSDLGTYGGGTMYYSDLINSNLWTFGACDLAFQTLWTSYTGFSRTVIGVEGGQARVSGLMVCKGVPVVLQNSTNLQNWATAGTNANLDGLASWARPVSPTNEFFRTCIDALGDVLTLTSTNLSTNVVTLYAEDFSGAATNLNGVTPDTTTAGAKWTAPTSTLAFLANGALTNNTAATAYLPIAPTNGARYILTAQMAQGGADTNSWVAFGFLRNPPGTGAIHSGTPTGIIWALTRNDSANPNQVLHENVAGGTGLAASGDSATGATTVTMSLVLDTTGGPGAWNYDWIVNGVLITNRTLPARFESVIGGVGIAKLNSISPHAFRAFGLTQQ